MGAPVRAPPALLLGARPSLCADWQRGCCSFCQPARQGARLRPARAMTTIIGTGAGAERQLPCSLLTPVVGSLVSCRAYWCICYATSGVPLSDWHRAPYRLLDRPTASRCSPAPATLGSPRGRQQHPGVNWRTFDDLTRPCTLSAAAHIARSCDARLSWACHRSPAADGAPPARHCKGRRAPTLPRPGFGNIRPSLGRRIAVDRA